MRLRVATNAWIVITSYSIHYTKLYDYSAYHFTFSSQKIIFGKSEGMEYKSGLVIKSTGSRYSVLNDDNEIIICHIRGKLRLNDIRSTNPVSVGDKVKYTLDNEEGVICEIEDRKNYIIRRATNLSKSYNFV